MSAAALGRYEIVETLGRGAMGVVYLAQDPALGRLVALKALSGKKDTPDAFAASCLREARAAGGLDHPNIVTVHDVADGDQPFIAMEYVQGTDLKEILKPGQPLPQDFIIKVVGEVAEALDYAHSRGIVHRDVKPANILITDDERVKLTDFGIAAPVGEAGGAERLGTPHYVAPEQLRGSAVDGRADVFALGVVLYEMLTGRRPFDAPDLKEVVRRLANEPFKRPQDHGVSLPAAVEAVLHGALAKSASERFGSAGELAEALRSAFQSQDEAATRDLSDLLPELPADAEPTRPRRPVLVWALAGLVALLGATSGAWVVLQRAQEPDQADGRTAPPHRLLAPHAGLAREAEDLLAAGDPLAAEKLLDLAVRMAPHRPELRSLHATVADQADTLRHRRQREGRVGQLLLRAQRAREDGRYRDALSALVQAAEIDPDQPAVQELTRRVRARLAGRQSRAAREQPEPTPRPAAYEPTVEIPTPAPTPRPKPAADWADLRVDLFSHLPRGVLTLYAGNEQILLQPFRFGKRSGLLRRQSGAGRLEARRRLPAGATEIRIYVSFPGQPTASHVLELPLPGGSMTVLRVLVDGSGQLAVQVD